MTTYTTGGSAPRPLVRAGLRPAQENTMKKDDVYKRMFKAEATADNYREALEEMQVLLESARACNDVVYIGTLIQRLEHIVEKTLKT